MRRNSVLNWLSDRILADIHWETRSTVAACRCRMLAENSEVTKEMESWLSPAYMWWPTDESDLRELSGVVYMNKRGPKTNPCGTPRPPEDWAEEVKLIVTMNLHDDNYDGCQEVTLPSKPNQVAKRWRRIELSMVSKAADGSKRHKAVTCCWDIALMMWSWTARSVDSVEW